MRAELPPTAELCCRSAFSFGEGASLPEDLIEQAAALGLHSLAITDRDGVYGLPRAWKAAVQHGVRLICGALLTLVDGPGLVALARDATGWTRLCHLLTRSRCGGPPDEECVGSPAQRRERQVVKGRGQLTLEEVLENGQGLHLIAMGDWSLPRARALRQALGPQASLGLVRPLDSHDRQRVRGRLELSRDSGLPLLATNDVLMHSADRQRLQDVLTCIRLRCTLDQAGEALQSNSQRHLLSPAAMWARWGGADSSLAPALSRAVQVAEDCTFSLDQVRYRYPREVVPEGETPIGWLRQLVDQGAAERYPQGTPPAVRKQLDHELALIQRMDFPAYFLTVNDAVRFARSQGILCQGRGSAANSAVCYVLGVTSVDPASSSLLFERFISEERGEPPDIDIDFEHERREEVFRYIYARYGRQRAAMVNEVISWRRRSAIRDVGQAVGLSADQVDNLARQVHWFDRGQITDTQLSEAGLDPRNGRVRLTLELADQLHGLPRHVGIHVGGFTISDTPLVDLCPIEPATMPGRTVIQWDKDDIDIMGFVKVDFLSLGMLTAIRKGFDLVHGFSGQRLELATVPSEDPAVYDMIGQADTVGVFQIESRAQMSMLPRLKPRTYYDLVVQVAIVRPGPIQGDMVHPYLRRREGLEPVHYPKPELEKVLGKTLGVPLFQEQAMRVAIECAGFTPGEADLLRKSMATFKHSGGVSHFREKLISGMTAKGYERDFAERIFRQLEGFGSYGFPESHAASFALIAYASAWLKCWHPDVFCAALLNSQPMGFYAPAQIVRDAEAHGVEVRPACANASRWDCTLEPTGEEGRLAVRLGLRMVRGLANAHAAAIVAARAAEPFASVDDLWRRAAVPQAALVKLAEADAFRPAFGLARREALWAIRGLADAPRPLFAAAAARARRIVPEAEEPAALLRRRQAGGEVVADYRHLGLTLRSHPVAFLREDLRRRRIVTCAEAMAARDGRSLEAAGIVLVRQRPGSAKGVLFITLEDETGIANLVVWPKAFEQNRRILMAARMLAVRGRIQRQGEVVHLVARRFADLSTDLASVGGREADFPLRQGRGDEVRNGGSPDRREREARLLRGRDLADPYGRIDAIRVKTRDFR